VAGHIVLTPLAAALPGLRRELALAPMIGENWSVCEADDPRLTRIVADAARSSGQRRQLRTTLDRANLRLSARNSVDPGRYRSLFLSDRYLATILTQALDPIIALEGHDVVAAWNRGAERVFGYSARAAVGVPVTSLGGWPARLADALKETRTAVEPVVTEVSVHTDEGERHFRANVSAVRDDAGSYLGAAVIMHDITASMRTLAAEQAARAEAEQMSRMKDEFLATLSHELRTPLSAVLSWAQLLQMRQGDSEYRQGVEAIQRNARIQAQLIDDLLDISRIVTGHPFLEIQPVSMVEVAERAMAVVAPAAAAKEISIHKFYEEAVAAIQGDAKRLQQVMWNLLANAVKFTPQRGHIDVRIRQTNSRVEVSVSDTGQGIEAEFLPHLFQRFRQSDASIRRRHGGLGLGLAIVKQLVELHGGAITGASPGPGKGSVFTFHLPISAIGGQKSRPERPSTAERAFARGDSAPAVSLAGLRVLVVEDEADSRAALDRILRHWGAVTASAASVDEALPMIESFTPQVIVSDIGMPRRDGYDLIRTVREKGHTANALPAIALTAYARKEDAQRALAAGFQLHVTKPTDAHRLISAILQLSQYADGK
jgi:PAS domain S-box-containing protein